MNASSSSFFSSCIVSDMFVPQNNGEISDSILQNWTQQAIECYNLKGNCKKCSIAMGNYSFVCQMPKVVESLIQTIGKPDCTNHKKFTS